MFVGLSNKLDKEFDRREPEERAHGIVVGARMVNGQLFGEVGLREKAVGAVETFLIFTMAALNLAVMAWRVRPD